MNPEQDLLKPLRGMYLAQLRERTESVEAFLIHCRAGRLSDDESAVMQRQAHKLAGSGTIYGFPLITQTARALDEALQSLASAAPPTPAALAGLTESLLNACGQALLSVERGSQDPAVRPGSGAPQPTVALAPDAKTVLIADDDPVILELLALKFGQRGIRVLLASDGEAALKSARENLPDLALLDRMMPGLDRIAVLAELRNDPATRHIPVIFLTAKRQEQDILVGFRLGVADYVIKPFLPEELLARSLRLLEK